MSLVPKLELGHEVKLESNTARDRLVTRTLRKNGWRVLRIWERELARKNAARLAARLRQVLSAG